MRLFKDHLYADHSPTRDKDGYIRIDDLEMRQEVQQAVEAIWPAVTTENLESLTDAAGYRDDFYRLFGFNVAGVDYDADVDSIVKMPSID